MALSEFGFASLDLTENDFLTIGYIVQLGLPPNRIDILTKADGVIFENCYDSKVVVDMNGLAVNFINLENLKINKRASGRLQDLADLEKLQ